MNAAARPYARIVFYCLAILAAIFAFIFFMRMMEETGNIDKLRNQGVVSRAVVVEKKLDEMVIEGRRGRSRSSDLNVIRVRHVPKSEVKYADFPSKVPEADLPIAPPKSDDIMDESNYGGIMFVTAAVYERTNVGDMLTVVNTPWDKNSPELVEDVRSFDGGASFQPYIAISLVMTAVFGVIGWWIGRAPR
jgi:hypothetical protein